MLEDPAPHAAEGAAATGLDAQLCFALYAAGNAMTRAYRPPLAEMGLTYPQYLVLLVLWRESRCTSGELARRLGLAPNAMTPLLDRMREAGLLTRTRDAHDRRRVHVALTERGRALEAQAARVQSAVAQATGLDPAAAAELRDRLHLLADRMRPDD